MKQPKVGLPTSPAPAFTVAKADNNANCPFEKTTNQSTTAPHRICNQPQNPVLIITNRKIPFADHKPTTQATSLVDFEKQATLANNLTTLIESIPGVAENGQPGLYQVVSIRGVSRQRVLTLFEDVRLTSERRAGVAASFIDPLMMGNVTVIRGPVSTYYGSGAIGGVMQLEADKSDGMTSLLGYRQAGNEQFQLLRWGDVDGKIAVTNRQANNSDDINHTPLNTHFAQTNLFAQKSFSWSDLQLENFVFISDGRNLGRSNSRFPRRIVNNKNERHRIFKLRLNHKDNWSGNLYLHRQSTASDSLKPSISRSDLLSESHDFGSSWQTAWKSDSAAHLLGVDYFARRQVNIYETRWDLVTLQSQQQQTLKQGFLDEIALFYTQHLNLKQWRLQLGGRSTFERSGRQQPFEQIASGFKETSNSQTAITGFFGAAYNISEQLEVNANIGNAFRFASLTERFFSGTTARGQVVGNPDLQAEKATTFDLGFNASVFAHQIKLNFFANQFDNYIQRVPLSSGELTYINQDQGLIKGLELEYHYAFEHDLEFILSGMAIKGSNDSGQALADIPSNRVNLQIFYHSNQLRSNLRLQHRFAKKDPVDGEIATASVNILSANIAWELTPSWQLNLYADNLLNQSYYNSADDLSTLALGRNFGITIAWRSN